MYNKQYSNSVKIYQFLNQENNNNNFQKILFKKDIFVLKKVNKNIKNPRKRNPKEYKDKYSIKKAENNTLILHACKLLKSYYNGEGIRALILDGKEMRTTNSLKFLDSRLKELIIVEFNKETYGIIKDMTKSDNNITCYNCHINDYIKKYNNPYINVVYFDLMLNFFSSPSSFGSDFVINEFLLKSVVNELIFAATFCLRNAENMNFDNQVEKILLCLEKIFCANGFQKTTLISKNNMRYRGQRGPNKALMFVLYYLKKNNKDIIENENELKIFKDDDL